MVTADHGSTYGKHFYGTDAGDGATRTAGIAGYLVTPATPSDSTSHSPAGLKPLLDTGNVEFSYQSTAIETWLRMLDCPWSERSGRPKVMASLQGVIATYVRRDGEQVHPRSRP